MRVLLVSLVVSLVACGGEGGPKTYPAEEVDDATAADVASAADAEDAVAFDSAPSETSSSTDAVVDTAPKDPCEGRLLCDDFESATVGGAPAKPWTVSTNKGTVTVTDTKARSGKKSIKVTTEAGSYKKAFFSVTGDPVFPIASNVVYARMMIYMDHTANDGVHWTMIEGSGPVPEKSGVRALYRYGGMHMGNMMANYETSGASTDCWFNSDVHMPEGRWACMEVKYDGENDQMRFWLDGKEVPELAVDEKGQGCIGHDLGDAWLGPKFDTMRFGWESYQTDDAREAYIDDVIVDDEPIGCPTP